MIRPKVGRANNGQIMSVELVNGMIARTEYAADLLRQYKLTAGNGMYVEQHYDGTRVSYLQPVGGGATPSLPLLTQNERNLFGLVGRSGTGGNIFNSSDQQSLFDNDDNPYIIDLADITRYFGSNASVRATGVVGQDQFASAFGYINPLFASWVFAPGQIGTFTSTLPNAPTEGSTQMQIVVLNKFDTLSFATFYP
jgi:hypothetical protein